MPLKEGLACDVPPVRRRFPAVPVLTVARERTNSEESAGPKLTEETPESKLPVDNVMALPTVSVDVT